MECFFQENSIEVLNLIVHSNQEELFEMMRIYIERVNYLSKKFRMADLLTISLILKMIYIIKEFLT